MRNFVQDGNVITVAAPSGGVLSGEGLLVGSMFGIAAYDAEEAAEVEVQVVGVFDLPKTAADEITVGEKLYWDDTAKEVTVVATSNTAIGVAVRDAAAATTTVRVRLNGSF